MLAGLVGFSMVAAAAAEEPSCSELIKGAMADSALSATKSNIIV